MNLRVSPEHCWAPTLIAVSGVKHPANLKKWDYLQALSWHLTLNDLIFLTRIRSDKTADNWRSRS
jgi:hypothetical protein